jgi:hypothetical protein
MPLGLILAEMVRQGNVAEAKRLAGKNENDLRDIAEARIEAGDLAGAKATYNKPFVAMVIGLANAGDISGAQKMHAIVLKERAYVMQDDGIRMLGAIARVQARAGDMAGAQRTVAQATKMAEADKTFGDKRAVLLANLLESLLTGGKREW